MKELEPLERLDEVNDFLRLIQKTDGLTFGTDALLLAAFVRGNRKYRAIEFGAGSGIISLLCAARGKAGKILAVEAQQSYAELTRRNISENNLGSIIEVACVDLRDTKSYGGDDCDLIFTNPPYMTVTGGYPNKNEAKNIARHEVLGGISDFCRAAASKLRYGGHLYCVYRPDRITDLLAAMRESRIEPKRMTVVTASHASVPSLVLVEGKRGGSPGLVFTPPLFLYRDETHTAYSDEMNYILEHGSFMDREVYEK